ncbi:MAG: MarC family protein [Prevotellaceae bacterium]|nr:MarC family protein [Prevotellaceae bacterium]
MTIEYLLSRLDIAQVLSAFIVLFAVIDVLGSIPIFIDLKRQGRPVDANKATLLSTAMLVGFFYFGNAILALFSVDIRSFAVAGSIVILFMAMEMILDVEIFKNSGTTKEATLIPVVFPLIAGAGSFTTLLSLRAEFASINIMLGLALNMLFVHLVLRTTEKLQRMLPPGAIYMMRKFFGIILLAIAVRLFTVNLSTLVSEVAAT